MEMLRMGMLRMEMLRVETLCDGIACKTLPLKHIKTFSNNAGWIILLFIA
jgi:hypothetical protein